MAFEGKAEAPAGVMPDRAQPHDPAVERAVLAAMLREPEPCVDIAIEHLRSPEVFYSHVHREIFRVIVELNSKPHRHAGSSSGVDLVTVAHQLQSEGKLEAVGGELFPLGGNSLFQLFEGLFLLGKLAAQLLFVV